MPSHGVGKNLRDELITKARYGEITPAEAEAEAAKHGLEPFERQPSPADFDPRRESRWSIVMAISWIAWRSLTIVRENSFAFRSECTHWIFREWNEPVRGGMEFAPRKGFFLEQWHEPTVVRLGLLEAYHKAQGPKPRMELSVRAAEHALWTALAEGQIVAEAVGSEGRPIDIPQREWSYLKLYEEGKRDVLKYDALDRKPAFDQVKLKQEQLLRLWPPRQSTIATQFRLTEIIEPCMLEPILNHERAGYVPLCVALHWIMTKQNTRRVRLADRKEWDDSARALFNFVSSGEIEVIGVRADQSLPDRIQGHELSMVQVLSPFHLISPDDIDLRLIELSGPAHIDCTIYVGEPEWRERLNDQLYESGRVTASWTHLQVNRAALLRRWPRPSSKANAEAACFEWLLGEMRRSPGRRPKSRLKYFEEGKARFNGLAKRQFVRAWDKALSESGAHDWSRPGPTRSDRRAS